jgi:hypothetical protein
MQNKATKNEEIENFYKEDEKDFITFNPNVIFKYSDYNNEYFNQTLSNLTLHASRLKDYNDPFEKDFLMNSFFDKMSLDHFTHPCWQMEELINLFLEKCVCICFSKTPHEPLMWSHYTGCHEGICYCFKDDLFDRPLDRIVYSTNLPIYDFILNETTLNNLGATIRRIVMTKSHHWAYEKEVRYCNPDGKEFDFKFRINSLYGIIVGVNTKPEVIQSIKESIEIFHKMHDIELKLFYAIKDKHSYSMKIAKEQNTKNEIIGVIKTNDAVITEDVIKKMIKANKQCIKLE